MSFLSAGEAFCRELPEIQAKSHAEIDAILRKSEREIKSGKRDLDKEGMSLEEYKRRRKEAWE